MAELGDGFAAHAFEIDVIVALGDSLLDGIVWIPDDDCL